MKAIADRSLPFPRILHPWPEKRHSGSYDRRTRRVRDLSCGDARIFLDIEVRRVLCKSCEHVKRERLDFLAHNPFYTKRFAYYVGRRCRQATIKDIAEELRLHWETITTQFREEPFELEPPGHPSLLNTPQLRAEPTHNVFSLHPRRDLHILKDQT